jgi:prepilin-type processing-associated H-X9-DG protein
MKEARVAGQENGNEFNGQEAGGPIGAAPALVQTPGLTVGGYGATHPGVVMVAFGDGHVQGMSTTTAMKIMRRLGHRADGRLLDADF